MSITIDPDDNTYDLGELRLDKEVIVCEDFNVDFSSESETRPATNSRDPVGYKGGKNEYKWEANSVSPEFFSMLREYQRNRRNFPIGVFNFNDDGDYKELFTLLHCRIDSCKPAQEDEGMSIDVSGIALSVKDKK